MSTNQGAAGAGMSWRLTLSKATRFILSFSVINTSQLSFLSLFSSKCDVKRQALKGLGGRFERH